MLVHVGGGTFFAGERAATISRKMALPKWKKTKAAGWNRQTRSEQDGDGAGGGERDKMKWNKTPNKLCAGFNVVPFLFRMHI